MYSTSISTKMTFEDKKGPKVEYLDVEVNGYKDKKELKKAKEYYKSETFDESPSYCRDDWRVPLWYTMFYGMLYRLRNWKNRVL